MLIDDLSMRVTGRASDLFSADLAERSAEVSAAVRGRRLLVIGGAGSIGSATIRSLIDFGPRSLHVIDQNENGLAELVRDLRSTVALPVDFRALPLDVGSLTTRRFLLENEPYDAVLNFAALKHVRSEKDAYSTLQILDTNILKAAHLLKWLEESRFSGRYFSVSTDKAAKPVNLMGASKRAMEHVMFSGECAQGFSTSSARFANVAFSDGSLLQSFLRRMEKRQPIAVPRDTRRFFVSLRESGQICVLAAACAPDRHLLIPRLDPSHDLVLLEDVAAITLRAHGLEPVFVDREDEAKALLATRGASRQYPVLRTALDTSGEKAHEEFLSDGEAPIEAGLPNLLAVAYKPARAGEVTRLVARLETLLAQQQDPVRKEDLVVLLGELLPELRHIETGRTLDERM